MSSLSNYTTIYSLSDIPVLQNVVYDTKEEAINCKTGTLNLIQCHDTGLIYNAAFNPTLIEYNQNYQNEQAASHFFQEHLHQVSNIIINLIGSEKLIEIGCGKGYFLELMQKYKADIIGFDPAYEGSNPNVRKCFFEHDSANKGNGIILRHVLEHIQDPVSFLHKIRDSNKNSGKIYIEVPCFDWICKNKTWFDIYYEHVNYFRLSDFYRIFDHIIESGHLFGGQYIYVVADINSLKEEITPPCELINFPIDFLGGLHKLDKGSKTSVVWGGSSKGVIFALLNSRLSNKIDFAIDINPAKQGKYLPKTGLKVLSPVDALSILSKGDCIYIVNSNYSAEIKKFSNDFQYIEVTNE